MHNQIKAMHIITGLGVAGLENVAISLALHLNCAKYAVSICSLDDNKTQEERLTSQGIPVFYMHRGPGIDYCLPFRLAKILRSERIQLVHTHNATCYFYGVLAAFLARTPIVVHTEHGRIFPDKKIIMFVNHLLSYRVDKIVAVCELLKERLHRFERINAKKIQVIVNGIDSALFNMDKIPKEKARQELGFKAEEKLIGIVARLYPVKNHSLLLKVFKLLKIEIPEARLLIVGDGPERDNLEVIAKQLGINNQVFFLGTRNDIPLILSALDIFVLCSHSEGLSLTILEAMAASLPVVATKVGGNPEVIQEGYNGFLVPPDSTVELAEKISLILKNRELGYRLGARGRELIEENYSTLKMVYQYECIYDELIWKKLIKREDRACNNYVPQLEGQNFVPGVLGGYYNDLSAKVNYNGFFPEAGQIALINYGKDIGIQENPLVVEQTTLGSFEIWLKERDEKYKAYFLKLAEWLVQKQKIKTNDTGVWEFNFNWHYGLKPPWISAMAQGMGISVFLRAHQLTKEDRFLGAAKKALKPFEQNVEEGGVQSLVGDGTIFFEEYPSRPATHVLNGFIFSLWGLYDYTIYTKDHDTIRLFEKGIESLEKNLPRYDLGYWSSYDLYPLYKIKPIANTFYHKLHIAQLKALYRLTGKDVFLQTARKWEKYQKNIIFRWIAGFHFFMYLVYCRLSKVDE